MGDLRGLGLRIAGVGLRLLCLWEGHNKHEA